MALSPEQTSRLQAIQGMVQQGTATKEDVKEGLVILRQDRVAAQASSTKSRTAAAVDRKVVDPTAVLAGLMAAKAKLSGGNLTGA